MSIACALVKRRGFRGEREARVVVTARWGVEHSYVRANELGVVRYLRLAAALDPDETHGLLPKGDPETRSLPVTGVTVGPGTHFARALGTLRLLLRRAGMAGTDLDSVIRKSKVELKR